MTKRRFANPENVPEIMHTTASFTPKPYAIMTIRTVGSDGLTNQTRTYHMQPGDALEIANPGATNIGSITLEELSDFEDSAPISEERP